MKKIDITQSAKLIIPYVTPIINETKREKVEYEGHVLSADNIVSKHPVLAHLSQEEFKGIVAKCQLGTLGQLKKIEERQILLGNNKSPLGKTGTPSLSFWEQGKMVAGDYSVVCVALTAFGMQYTRGVRNPAAQLSVLPYICTGGHPPGNTFTYGGGSAIRSEPSSITFKKKGSIVASVKPTKGAVGYGWFVNGALHAITSVSSVVIKENVFNTQKLDDNFIYDSSINLFGYHGLIYQAKRTYDNGGEPLTKFDNTGTVDRIWVNKAHIEEATKIFGSLVQPHVDMPKGTVLGYSSQDIRLDMKEDYYLLEYLKTDDKEQFGIRTEGTLVCEGDSFFIYNIDW